MRSLSVARKELGLMRKVLNEFLQDYDYAQSEEDMSAEMHKEYSLKIGEVYYKCKDIEKRLAHIG